MIQAEHIYKSFNGKEVLSDVSVTFDTGKVNLVIGKSGSGKTVLIKSLLGLHNVDCGHILYDGHGDMTLMDMQSVKKLRQHIGVVFQQGALFDSLTVLENVMFPLNMFTKLSEEEQRDRAMNCLHRVNLINAENRYPAEISGGMMKRVAIARAIVLRPQYLFFDEPNSGLDPVTSVVIDNLILELTHEYQMTTIVNTHDMNSVFEIGEKIVFISGGCKVWEGSRSEIANSDHLELNDFIFSSELFKKIKMRL